MFSSYRSGSFFFIVTPIVGVCNWSMFCCTLLYVHSSIAIILMRKRELVALLILSSWCLVMVEWLFLAVPWGCLRFVIVVFPDHTYLLFFRKCSFYGSGFDFCQFFLDSNLFLLVTSECNVAFHGHALSIDLWLFILI